MKAQSRPHPGLLPLSLIRLKGRNVPHVPSAHDRLMAYMSGRGKYDPDPPSPEEVSEAFRFKYGL